ncbi:MAG: glycosyltransferase [Armatimonadetes bacterium]|nr:glycosyltransferase [Armatimonadota bacterium]
MLDPDVRRSPAAGRKVRVTVVMPTYNRAGWLLEALASLEAQQGAPPFEVIVVDDGSTDDTPARLGEWLARTSLSATVVRQANRGPAAARNHGVRVGRGKIIAFLDDDCVAAPDWLAELTRGMAEAQDLAGAGGALRPLRVVSLAERYCAHCWPAPPHKDPANVEYIITANAAYRREVLARAGGFDEGFQRPGGEDPDLSYRIRQLGYRLEYRPQAVVQQRFREGLGGLARTFWNYGRGHGRYVWKKGERHPGIYYRAVAATLAGAPGRLHSYRREGLPWRDAFLFAAITTAGMCAWHWACAREMGRALHG